MTQVDVPELLQRHGRNVEAYLDRALSARTETPPRLMESVRYSLRAGGKRMRPALILECFAACSMDTSRDEISALACASAMELIHTFSLVHDDLPAMDDDDLRRGVPTNHKVFGEAMAILAGDAMTTLAFELIGCDAESSVATRLVCELARAAGPEGMIGGQVLDIDGENQSLDLPALQKVHRMKTGALLTASCRMGAIAGGASAEQIDALTRFGEHLGLAFQIVDDVLDVTATPEQMGKATGKDAGRGKNTYPALMGLEQSRAEADRQLEQAVEALKDFDGSADGLRALARFVVRRTH